MSITWPDFKLPPINLYNVPLLYPESPMNEPLQPLGQRFLFWKQRSVQEQLSHSPEDQYLGALQRIQQQGRWINNDRTGIRCLTVINIDFTYNVGAGVFPLVTTRKLGIKTAIGELLGYLRGYTNAEDFAALGAKSWYMNANETPAWLANPHRKGENDTGPIYGAVARDWPKHDGTTMDLLTKIVDNLTKGVDDRGEILTFWNPGMFELVFAALYVRAPFLPAGWRTSHELHPAQLGRCAGRPCQHGAVLCVAGFDGQDHRA